jgi:hypothetical protein
MKVGGNVSYAHVFASVLHKDGGECVVLFHHLVNDIKEVVHLGRAEIQAGSTLAANRIRPFDLGRSKFSGLGYQSRHVSLDLVHLLHLS